MYTTDITDNGTVSATDEERLPPGGFSLRHGFPDWFGRGSRSRQTSGQHPNPAGTPPPLPPRPGSFGDGSSNQTTPDKSFKTALSTAVSPAASAFTQTQSLRTSKAMPSTYDVLTYLASAFDSEEVLDSIPLEAAGNPGAWHAWRARQRTRGRGNPVVDVRGEVKRFEEGKPLTARKPGEWNWEGVWEERVKRGIGASLSEAVLFGNSAGADEVINFLNMDETDVQGVKDNLFRTLGVAPPQAAESEPAS